MPKTHTKHSASFDKLHIEIYLPHSTYHLHIQIDFPTNDSTILMPVCWLEFSKLCQWFLVALIWDILIFIRLFQQHNRDNICFKNKIMGSHEICYSYDLLIYWRWLLSSSLAILSRLACTRLGFTRLQLYVIEYRKRYDSLYNYYRLTFNITYSYLMRNSLWLPAPTTYWFVICSHTWYKGIQRCNIGYISILPH